MSGHFPRIDLYEEQPDSGGNRHYDYISVEEHDAAEKLLKNRKEYKDITFHEVVVLRSQFRRLGISKDIVDHTDRLGLLRCLKSHCENRDQWREYYYWLKEKTGCKENPWDSHNRIAGAKNE